MLKTAGRFSVLLVLAITTACSGGRGWTLGDRVGIPPEPGDAAPGFSLASSEGADISLAQFRGKSPVLFYFSMGPG